MAQNYFDLAKRPVSSTSSFVVKDMDLTKVCKFSKLSGIEMAPTPSPFLESEKTPVGQEITQRPVLVRAQSSQHVREWPTHRYKSTLSTALDNQTDCS